MADEEAPTREELMKFIKVIAWQTSRKYAMTHLKGSDDTCRFIHFKAMSLLKKASAS